MSFKKRNIRNNNGSGLSRGYFDIKSLGNCEIYLRSDQGIVLNGSTVSRWEDQSGNNRHFFQSTAANQPTYVGTDSSFGNQASLKFDGVSQQLIHTSSVPGMSESSIYCVTKINSATLFRGVISIGSNTSGSLVLFIPSAGQLQARVDNPPGVLAGSNVAYNVSSSIVATTLIGWSSGGSCVSMSLNGSNIVGNAFGSITAITSSTRDIVIGTNASGYIDQNFLSLIVFSKKHNETERKQVEQSLMKLYGIGI